MSHILIDSQVGICHHAHRSRLTAMASPGRTKPSNRTRNQMNPWAVSSFCILTLACRASAALLISDPVEPDGIWTLGQSALPYLPAGSGLSPTAGEQMMHFNAGGDVAAYGTSFVIYSNTLAA